MAGPTTSPVEAEEIVVSGATVAPHVSRPRQASFGPSTLRLRRRLRRAHRGPGGYCLHSGNQGTTGRPARAHNTHQEISLRTRLSKPGEAPMTGEASPRSFPLARDLLFERVLKTKAWRGLQPREDSFLAKPALSPRQSAHGLCTLRRVPGTDPRYMTLAASSKLMISSISGRFRGLLSMILGSREGFDAL